MLFQELPGSWNPLGWALELRCGLCCQWQARDTLMAARGLAEGAAPHCLSPPASLSCLCLIMANAWMNHLSLRDSGGAAWWRTSISAWFLMEAFFAAEHCYSHAAPLLGFQAHRNGTPWRTCAKFRVAAPFSVFLLQPFLCLMYLFSSDMCSFEIAGTQPLALKNSSPGWCDDPRNIPSHKCDDERAKQSSCHHAGTNSEALQWCQPATVMAPVLPA